MDNPPTSLLGKVPHRYRIARFLSVSHNTPQRLAKERVIKLVSGLLGFTGSYSSETLSLQSSPCLVHQFFQDFLSLSSQHVSSSKLFALFRKVLGRELLFVRVFIVD